MYIATGFRVPFFSDLLGFLSTGIFVLGDFVPVGLIKAVDRRTVVVPLERQCHTCRERGGQQDRRILVSGDISSGNRTNSSYCFAV